MMQHNIRVMIVLLYQHQYKKINNDTKTIININNKKKSIAKKLDLLKS